MYVPACISTCVYICMCVRDLQYITIQQNIDKLIEYHIVILCSMNFEISAGVCLMSLI